MTGPQEPPVVTGAIPYVGHIVGLMRSKFNYYVQLSQQQSLPIFTVNMPGQKMYIVTKLDLIQAIQKQPKILAFPPIEAKWAAKICGVSREAEDIVNKNVNGEEGETGFSMESYAAMRVALSPSAEFDEMNRQMIQNLEASLDEIKPSTQQTATRLGLSSCFRRIVTAASTDSVYGPQSPFKDQAVVDAFWQFNNDLTPILVGVFTSITARKGLAARAKLAKAFEEYFGKGCHKTGSLLASNRYEVAIKNGLALEDFAKFECAIAVAILSNTAPASFWMLFFVYSTPGLLDDIRKEIDSIVTESHGGDGLKRSVDLRSLKQRCPLLISAFQETLRWCSIGSSIREVLEDTVLDSQWLLKKNSIVQMPSRIIHKDSSLWGDNVDDYQPRRFLTTTEPRNLIGNGRKRPSPAALRVFGGGTTLCPGRHFATNEALAVTAMFVLRFDMVPVAGSWSIPSTDKTNMAGFLVEPDTDIEVEITLRRGFEEGRFTCGLQEPDTILAVTAEDHPT